MAATVDVLVVGLGPAGASAAAAAARAGRSVLAIDRRRTPGRPVQCAELVPAMLASDVPAVVRTATQPIDAMRTFVEDQPPHWEPRFPGFMLDRARFDAELVAEAVQAGATCRFGTCVQRIGHAGVQLATGDTVAARVVIGADGPRSMVGRAVGQVNAALVDTRQLTVRLCRPQRSTDIHLSGGIAGGYGWLFPKGDLANLGAGVAAGSRSALKAIVTRLHRRLAAQGQTGSEVLALTGGVIPVGGMLDPVAALGNALVLLAGDAAGLTNPITGAGIAAAVLSGRMAGAAAAAHLDGDLAAEADYREQLDALFGAALRRALAHRQRLAAAWATGRPTPAELRRGWIAYPEYWTAPAATAMEIAA